MNDTILDTLFMIQQSATDRIFYEIFGVESGSHLWRQFTDKYESNIIILWSRLDNVNRKKLRQYIHLELFPLPPVQTTMQNILHPNNFKAIQ